MKHADPEQLQTVISRVISESRVGNQFRNLTLEEGDYNDESELLRVVVRMSDIDGISDDDFDSLTSSIENAVGKCDDRFPSVRYAEP